jgi:hypothetical protein
MHASANYINLLHPKGGQLTSVFRFDNHKRNLQVAFPVDGGLELTLHYGPAPVYPPVSKVGVYALSAMLGGAAVYLLLGAVYMNKVKGENGLYMIPHRDFWAGLPSLAKDGCRFTLNVVLGWKVKMRLSTNYEEL